MIAAFGERDRLPVFEYSGAHNFIRRVPEAELSDECIVDMWKTLAEIAIAQSEDNPALHRKKNRSPGRTILRDDMLSDIAVLKLACRAGKFHPHLCSENEINDRIDANYPIDLQEKITGALEQVCEQYLEKERENLDHKCKAITVFSDDTLKELIKAGLPRHPDIIFHHQEKIFGKFSLREGFSCEFQILIHALRAHPESANPASLYSTLKAEAEKINCNFERAKELVKCFDIKSANVIVAFTTYIQNSSLHSMKDFIVDFLIDNPFVKEKLQALIISRLKSEEIAAFELLDDLYAYIGIGETMDHRLSLTDEPIFVAKCLELIRKQRSTIRSSDIEKMAKFIQTNEQKNFFIRQIIDDVFVSWCRNREHNMLDILNKIMMLEKFLMDDMRVDIASKLEVVESLADFQDDATLRISCNHILGCLSRLKLPLPKPVADCLVNTMQKDYKIYCDTKDNKTTLLSWRLLIEQHPFLNSLKSEKPYQEIVAVLSETHPMLAIEVKGQGFPIGRFRRREVEGLLSESSHTLFSRDQGEPSQTPHSAPPSTVKK